mgnify:CR=1 FL=1
MAPSGRPWGAAAIEHREPDGGGAGRGPFHAVAVVRGDVQTIARRQQAGVALVLETQGGSPTEQHDPLAFGLVVPEAGWAGLPAGDDTLHADARAAEQFVDTFGAGGIAGRQGGQQVVQGPGEPSWKWVDSTMDAIALARAA